MGVSSLKEVQGKKKMDSIGSVAESEESDELLVVSEEHMGCSVSKTTSKGSTKCRGFKKTVMMFEVQRQAQ